MTFPYSFLELVAQLGRYEALRLGYHNAIEKALKPLFLSENNVAEIRAGVKVQGQSFSLIADIFGGLIETHQPKEGNFPKIAYLFREGKALGRQHNEKFCFYGPFLKDGKKPNGFQEGYGIVRVNETESCLCDSCHHYVPIIYRVTESETPTRYMVCLKCEIALTI